MTQKVLKVGDSAAVTIPKKSLEKLGLKIGDSVDVEIEKDAFVVKSMFKPDKELIEWIDRFINKYRPALEALAKK